MFDVSPGPVGLPLTEADHELIETARELLRRRYRPAWHTVAAAIRSRDGRVWTGLHLGATVGRMSVCAEAVALGRAIIEGDGTIAAAVAVRHPKAEEDDRSLAVVAPCGGCREMILDYDPDALVLAPTATEVAKFPIRSLLLLPYRR